MTAIPTGPATSAGMAPLITSNGIGSGMSKAMAQVVGVLFLSQPEHKGKIPFFCGIDGARFRKPVVPGDRLEMHVKVLKVRGATGKVQVEAKVDGETVADGELMFTIV